MCHSGCPMPVSGGAGIAEYQRLVRSGATDIPVFAAQPESGAGHAVIILHDIFGANDFYHDLARRLAAEGFLALLPDLFVRQGPLPEPSREAAMARGGQLDQTQSMADIAEVIRFAQRLERSTGRVGLVGFCMGGTLALLTAARNPLPDAAVAYYGFPAGRQGWANRPMDEVSEVRAPVLAFWGDQDHGVGMDNVNEYTRLASEHDAPIESSIYPDLPHGFLTFDPESPNYQGAKDSWTRTLAFLRDNLAGDV